MKRSDMVAFLTHKLREPNLTAEVLLDALEKEGMRPPSIGGDFTYAITGVYVFPDYNIWEEDFFKDSQLVEAFAAIKRRPKRNKR